MAEEVQKSREAQLCRQCHSFFGGVQTDFLCSKCFADQRKAAQTSAPPPAPAEEVKAVVAAVEESKVLEPEAVSRCAKCQRKLGLASFKCKCGDSFCSRHRVPEDHNCQFDYKTAGIPKLAANNPLVVARKIEEI